MLRAFKNKCINFIVCTLCCYALLEQEIDEQAVQTQGESQKLIAEEGELFQTHIGGAALIEGIMMRGKLNWSVAVRCADGHIHLEEFDFPAPSHHARFKTLPLVRGCVALFESLILSYKAMEIAGRYAYDFSKDSTSPAQENTNNAALVCDDQTLHTPHEKQAQPQGLSSKELALSLCFGLIAGIAGFIVLPAVITRAIMGDYNMHPFAWNAVDGFLRIAIFISYIWLIGKIPDIKRMFGYHGAEHKTIHCYEHGKDLTVTNCQCYSTQHVRCGTAFLIMTMIISIFVFTVFPVNLIVTWLGVHSTLIRFMIVLCSRILLLPLIAGIAFELSVKWAGSRPHHPLVKFIVLPGLKMQLLTTNTPDDGMLECAIRATQKIINKERSAVPPAQSTPSCSLCSR